MEWVGVPVEFLVGVYQATEEEAVHASNSHSDQPLNSDAYPLLIDGLVQTGKGFSIPGTNLRVSLLLPERSSSLSHHLLFGVGEATRKEVR